MVAGMNIQHRTTRTRQTRQQRTAVLPVPVPFPMWNQLDLFPHGVGNSLGMDVHDVSSASKPVNNTTIPQDNVEHPNFTRTCGSGCPSQRAWL
ncbi:uncharacterized protein EDB91DRAFT_470061 [Suillus paluster]|uniref:uncharacterized protein n=1 Tax=Suillus paluster TaxID=48578 RepID=UPI001B87D3BE|nr:uncharacterized protein EDB91DRAFT_470061 [Suillus paluster]KAG1737821.1 hypothetical protein EDB91DRAFT_470061 [Suillus paluster]